MEYIVECSVEMAKDLGEHVKEHVVRCKNCPKGMIPNCYGIYCRANSRYMRPNDFCSLAWRHDA